MNNLFLTLPIVVFFIHMVFGPKMKLFGYEDGGDLTIIIPIALYLIGLTFMTNEMRGMAYICMIGSFTIRPAFHHLTQYISKRYVRRHPTLRHR